MGRVSLSIPQFLTVLSDIQLAINNRPLTFVDRASDINAITPNSLVSPSSHHSTLIISDVDPKLNEPFEMEEARLDFVDSLEKERNPHGYLQTRLVSCLCSLTKIFP